MSSVLFKSCSSEIISEKSLLYNFSENIFYKVKEYYGGDYMDDSMVAIPSVDNRDVAWPKVDSTLLRKCLFLECEKNLKWINEIGIETIAICFSVRKEEDKYYLVVDKNVAKQKLKDTKIKIEKVKSNFISRQEKIFETSINKIERDFFYGNFSDISRIGNEYENAKRDISILSVRAHQLKTITKAQI